MRDERPRWRRCSTSQERSLKWGRFMGRERILRQNAKRNGGCLVAEVELAQVKEQSLVFPPHPYHAVRPVPISRASVAPRKVSKRD